MYYTVCYIYTNDIPLRAGNRSPANKVPSVRRPSVRPSVGPSRARTLFQCVSLSLGLERFVNGALELCASRGVVVLGRRRFRLLVVNCQL